MDTLQQTIAFPDFINPRDLDASSESDGWYTPAWLIESAWQVLGSIDLDPATCLAAQAVIKAKAWYTKVEDGLARSWHGNVWCNPPYSDPLPWAERMVHAYQSSEIKAGMMLVNCSCSPKWAQHLWKHTNAVCLLNRRINFWHPTKTNANGSYDRDSALFYFGPEADLFKSVFNQYGVVR
jgi:ParB family chromosome partitioning protein